MTWDWLILEMAHSLSAKIGAITWADTTFSTSIMNAFLKLIAKAYEEAPVSEAPSQGMFGWFDALRFFFFFFQDWLLR